MPAARAVRGCAVATVALALWPSAPTQAQEGVAGHWEGQIEIPGQPLTVMVDLAESAGEWAGTIDIPAQGAKALPLHRIALGEGSGVTFAIQGVPGDPTFSGHLENGAIRGQFSQGGGVFPFTLGREAAPQPRRPQEPKAPFPYANEEVQFAAGPVRLAGTLTIPQGQAPFPAVLLISGSGLQNRDQELFGHKPFWVLADHLARAGIAVLRVDDAGAGNSTPHPQPPTTADFAADAAAAVDFLKDDARMSAIGLVGHSEGGAIAPMLASRRADVAFVVLLAAPGVPGAELMRQQNKRIFAAAGIGGEQREVLLGLIDQLFGILADEDASEDEVRQGVESVIRQQMAANGVPTDRQDAAQVRQAVEQALNPWLRYFLKLDPRPALAATKVPVLALNGDLDVQVDAEQNLDAIATALNEGGNEDVTVRRLAGLNHLFQPAKTGLVDEYANIETTMAPAVLDLVRDWVLARAGSASGRE